MLMGFENIPVFMATAPLDMRRSFDSLARLVQEQFKQNPFAGHLFVFHNRRCDRVKILYWDRQGFCLWMKRLEEGVFQFPIIQKDVYPMSYHELNLLLEGIALTTRRLTPQHYEAVN